MKWRRVPADLPSDEFDLIRQYFQPLAGEGGLSLSDDVACLEDRNLVISKDMLIAGVHFLPDDPPHLIARKALTVNVSDIACKGARPTGYFLGLALPADCTADWLEEFSQGLAQEQFECRICLLGGDTTRLPAGAPLVISVTMLGEPLAASGPVRRIGAAAGDILAVTGTIGDAGLGLAVATGALSVDVDANEALLWAYRLPEPPLGLVRAIATHASAAMDVSDGLLADAGHLARASNVDIRILLERVPLSDAARAWLAQQDDVATALTTLATAGDDYQILFTASEERIAAIVTAAELSGIQVTLIGSCEPAGGQGAVHVDYKKKPVRVERPGYNHFS